MSAINNFSKTLPAFLTWDWPMSAENVGLAFHAAPLIRFQSGRGARFKNPFPYPQQLARILPKESQRIILTIA